jgi:hypothetical protein
MAWASRLSKISNTGRGLWTWLIALALFAASLGLRFALAEWLDPLKFLTFYPAIALSALLFGWPQGLLVLILSTLSAWYYFLDPINSFTIPDSKTVIALIGFMLVAGFILLLIAGMRELIRRLESSKLLQEQLFGELQHRVANNLQIVVALIRVARRKLHDSAEAAEDALDQAEEKIHSMSRLHRHLYDSAASDRLAPILQESLADVFRDLPVKVRLHIQETNLSIGQMTPLILLVNEAATNAVKHVFSKGLGTQFEISLSKEQSGSYRLVIRDDGPGIKPRANSSPNHSLGMGIMGAFAQQLGGSLQVSDAPGTTLTVDFG